MNDGTQERTLDPPDDTLSDAETRECERAASDGFRDMDSRSRKWLEEQLADTPADIRNLVKTTLIPGGCGGAAVHWAGEIRRRYVAECAEEYWGDLIEQEKYAQEP